ncbi:MAG: cob(I)yrinic acid a,c-diamide adenosyltransferase [Deltaproteobacteria bacterium]|nr:cob(I)yrinic acid a,c-diamide adenosyltransferase [Deltaproteobacteria bacterium]
MPDESANKPRPADERRGLILVNTGDGKGKTTAALGTALRAVGYGQKVLVIQFIKGTWHYGELDAVARIPEITLVRAGKGFYKIIDDKFTEAEHREAAAAGLAFARESIAKNEHSLVILDEINVAVSLGLLDLADVIGLLDLKPPHMSLILTGRNAHPDVIARADTVTEMREIKHAFKQGILAKRGIDF